jgi:hypothetical protein
MTLRAIQPAARNPGDHPWLAGFLKQFRREDLSQMTLRSYQSGLQLFLRWYASPALEKLTAVDIMNYRGILVRPRSSRTTERFSRETELPVSKGLTLRTIR